MPSKTSESDWITYLNTAIRRYGRYIALEDVLRFKTVDKIQYYPLPQIGGEGIKGVTVGSRELTPVEYGQSAEDGSYCITPTGFLMLTFFPKGGEDVAVVYRAAVPFKTEAEVAARCHDKTEAERRQIYENQWCGVHTEYIDAIIYGAMAEMAAASEDITASDNYRRLADEVVRGAMQSRYAKHGKYPVTKVVRRWHCRCSSFLR